MKRILFSIACFLFLASQVFSQTATRARAYPFELKDTLGRVVKLSDFQGKTLILDFWFTGCHGCVDLASALHKFVIPEFRGDTNVVFIAVSIDINFLTWKKSIHKGIYTSEEELNLYTMGMGGDHPLFRHYGFSGCPQLLLIDKEGYLISSAPPYPESGNGGESSKFVSLIRQHL